MSKGLSYHCTATKGYIVDIAHSLPPNGQGLVNRGWKDISHPKQAATGSYTYKDPSSGLKIRYDEPEEGAHGFAGRDHFHILNPNATGKKDLYLEGTSKNAAFRLPKQSRSVKPYLQV